MKILHTLDWHLTQNFIEKSRVEEYALNLKEKFETITNLFKTIEDKYTQVQTLKTDTNKNISKPRLTKVQRSI